MRYLIAIVACTAEAVLFITLGVILFGWKDGGGILPMLVLFGIMGITWNKITKESNNEESEEKSDN